MDQNLPRALELIRHLEGGYVRDPHDPGGCTNLGITLGTFRAHLNPGGTCADLKKLSWAQAAEVYRRGYWRPARGPDLPAGVDLLVFDTAVHAGPGRALRLLQAALGVPETGALDGASWTALAATDAEDLVRTLVVQRLAWLRRLKTWPRFKNGWTNRVLAARDAALALIAEKKTLETRR